VDSWRAGCRANWHVRFGGRVGETGQSRGWYRASARPNWGKTLPTVIACLDTTMRRLGGVPTYALTDNEKTVTAEHVARIPVRHPEIVEVGPA
jgi:transposase